jgi:hypothetical protein
MVTYGTTVIPSDQISVVGGGTVSVSAAFENSVGLVGGMDTANGSATPAEVTTVRSAPDAADKFGEDSELHEQVQLAFQNGAGQIYALPVSETSVTGETQGTQDGTLDNAPVFDPRVNDEHSVTVTDTGAGDAEINLVDEPPESAPTTSEQVDFYPPTAEYYADAAPDGDYEFDYSYGDYSATAMQPILDEEPRMLCALTENESIINTVATELNDRATSFTFGHNVSGAQVDVDSSNYADGVDERRVSLVSPSRAYTDDAETNEVRTTGAVAGYLASLDLGLSATNDSLGGFSALKNPLSDPQSAGDLIDAQVMPLLDYPPTTIVKDMTTSTEPTFERVYSNQVVDEATELLHIISRNFVGDQNTPEQRNNMRRSYSTTLQALESATPPLLNDSTVSVQQDDADPNQTNVNVGIDVVDVMDIIDVSVTVGDIVVNNGAN